MPDYNPTVTNNVAEKTTVIDDDLDPSKRGFNDIARSFIREVNLSDEISIDKMGGLGSIILAGVATVTTSGAGAGTATVTLPVIMPSALYAVFLTPDGTSTLPGALNAETRTTTTFVIRVSGAGGAATFTISWMVGF